VTTSTGRAQVLSAVTEKMWQRQVESWARRAGWLPYHTHNSMGSTSGFPDLVLLRPRTSEVIYAELKTDRGKLSQPQLLWIDALKACGQRVFVWRPSDEQVVQETLQ
jgi:hypothetical protein